MLSFSAKRDGTNAGTLGGGTAADEGGPIRGAGRPDHCLPGVAESPKLRVCVAGDETGDTEVQGGSGPIGPRHVGIIFGGGGPDGVCD